MGVPKAEMVWKGTDLSLEKFKKPHHVSARESRTRFRKKKTDENIRGGSVERKHKRKKAEVVGGPQNLAIFGCDQKGI